VPPTIAEKKRKTAQSNVARKRKKLVSVDPEASSDGGDMADLDSPSQKITAYIDVVVTVQAVQGRKKPSSETISRGPFFFFDTTDFTSFQSLVAKTLPCSPSSLSWSKITWKFDTPANSRPKNLSNEAGYEAMVSGILERKKNYVVRILTPPPAKSETVHATSQSSSFYVYSDSRLALGNRRRQSYSRR
jgi:hypothetical protein